MGIAAVAAQALTGQPLTGVVGEVYLWCVHTAEGYVYGSPVGRAVDWILGQLVIGGGLIDFQHDRPVA
jgi:hypothetical protein